jgi:hypothetical protein
MFARLARFAGFATAAAVSGSRRYRNIRIGPRNAECPIGPDMTFYVQSYTVTSVSCDASSRDEAFQRVRSPT